MTAGCSDFLDVKPAGKLIPEKGDVQSYDYLLNNKSSYGYIFYNNNQIFHMNYATDQVEMSDNQADYKWVDGVSNIDCYFGYIFQGPYSNPNLNDYYWDQGTYSAALLFNAVIDGIADVRTPATAKQADEIHAQAVAARAWTYFQTAMVYGPVYKPGQDNSTKVIPYRTSSDVMSKMEDLSTLEEIVQRTKSEVTEIYNSLPEQAPNIRMGKIQASALLAQIALVERKFDIAAKHADDALKMAIAQVGTIDNLFYDYNLFTWSDPAAITDISKRLTSPIKQTQDTNPLTASYNREICFYRTCGNAGGAESVYDSSELLGLYDKDNDLRWHYFNLLGTGFKSGDADDGPRILNYQRKVASTNGYTYPEIVLMRAEARARANDLPGALSDLNTLRKFRYKTGTPAFTTTNSDVAINEIIKERRIELPVGSIKRFLDLKRLCLDTGKPWSKTSITHVLKGRTYKADIDSKYFIIPIKNTILQYNPQWGIPQDATHWSNSK